jgi:hypothetical protein
MRAQRDGSLPPIRVHYSSHNTATGMQQSQGTAAPAAASIMTDSRDGIQFAQAVTQALLQLPLLAQQCYQIDTAKPLLAPMIANSVRICMTAAGQKLRQLSCCVHQQLLCQPIALHWIAARWPSPATAAADSASVTASKPAAVTPGSLPAAPPRSNPQAGRFARCSSSRHSRQL